jgi:hypothetical protein
MAHIQGWVRDIGLALECIPDQNEAIFTNDSWHQYLNNNESPMILLQFDSMAATGPW